MKRIAALLICLALICTAAGCSGRENNPNDNPTLTGGRFLACR